MRHIIVGGSGFLGQHLADALVVRGETVIVGDINKPTSPGVRFVPLDVTRPSSFHDLPLESDDIVYHLAARLLVPIVPRRMRTQHFNDVNLNGTKNLLEHMLRHNCRSLIFFTTDMVYGHSQTIPRTEHHPIRPLGPYGLSKWAAEELCRAYRVHGINTTIFRPRLIIGHGRLGILERLFALVRRGLPLPMIGQGKNHYQFIAAVDCVEAAHRAVAQNIPNETFNLGSSNPPTVRALLRELIKHAGSRSRLLPTPARLVKRTLASLDLIGLPLMDPEQYLIADEDCILDISKSERRLGWRPQHSDGDMLKVAYDDFLARDVQRSHHHVRFRAGKAVAD